MPPTPLTRIRRLCLALPEAHEVIAWNEPTFRVRNRQFAMFASAHNHHGGGRPALWVKATIENQALLLDAYPARYFKPPYVGPSGWIGIWLDLAVVWRELPGLVEDAYRLVAPKRLLTGPAAPKARRSGPDRRS